MKITDITFFWFWEDALEMPAVIVTAIFQNGTACETVLCTTEAYLTTIQLRKLWLAIERFESLPA